MQVDLQAFHNPGLVSNPTPQYLGPKARNTKASDNKKASRGKD